MNWRVDTSTRDLHRKVNILLKLISSDKSSLRNLAIYLTFKSKLHINEKSDQLWFLLFRYRMSLITFASATQLIIKLLS